VDSRAAGCSEHSLRSSREAGCLGLVMRNSRNRNSRNRNRVEGCSVLWGRVRISSNRGAGCSVI